MESLQSRSSCLAQVIRVTPGFKHVIGVIPEQEKLFEATDQCHSAVRTGVYSHSRGGQDESRSFVAQLMCWSGYL